MVGLKDLDVVHHRSYDEHSPGSSDENQPTATVDFPLSQYVSYSDNDIDEAEGNGSGDDDELEHTTESYSDEDHDRLEEIDSDIPENVAEEESYEPAMLLTSYGENIWIHNVPDEFRPKLGQVFETIQAGEEFYDKYDEVAGFEIRKSNRKKNNFNVVTNRYLLCNREGLPKNRVFDTLVNEPLKRKRRNTNFKRCGCKANFKIKLVPENGNYVLYHLVEQHNHHLLTQEEMMFSKAQRHLTYQEQKNVFLSVSSKLGPSKVHRLRKAMKRGLLGLGGTLRDYQNYRRDIDNFVGNRDAQMLINKLHARKNVCPEYYFEYKCSDKELDILFWADETARANYKEFGDVISFDSTFRSNQHAMVFVPFVAIDNHFRTVVVGAALMRHETKVDYEWVLNAFLRVHGKQPNFVITDQCPAMRQAIPKVFNESRHRFCLWHIMDKVSGKVGASIANNTTFIAEMNDLVWNVNLEPEVFETGWHTLMDKFGLSNQKWLKRMFKIRDHWIPTYYKDFPMSGLMKTTSRSESVNAFFGVFNKFHHNLLFFLKAFDDAIEEQRTKHISSEKKTNQTTPRVVSPTKIEMHAAKVYTRALFFEVQNELNIAVWACEVDHVQVEGDTKLYTISEVNNESKKVLISKVLYNIASVTVDCSCNFFIRNGYLCRHAFKVLLRARFHSIPDKYIMRRWTRDIIPVQWLPAVVRYGEVDKEQEKLIAKATLNMEQIIGYVKHDKSSLAKFVEQLDDIRSSVILVHPIQSKKATRSENIQEFLAISEPDAVDVLPPTGIRNKGCGTGKRLKSTREKERDKAKKLKRKCKSCHKVARHDSRNCPEKNVVR